MSDSVDKLSRDAVLLEYTKAANPLAMGTISKVPYKTFPRALYEHSQTAMIPLDVSDVLQVDGPATSPALCANYVKILAVILISQYQRHLGIVLCHVGSGYNPYRRQ